MKKLVYIPLDATSRLLETGFSMEQIELQYNPQRYFEQVFVISPKDEVGDFGTLKFIQSDVSNIAKMIKEINPMAVRANAGYFCCDIALACRVRGIPIMVSVHDTLDERIRQSLAFADKVVCISNAVKDAVELSTCVLPERIMMMPRYVESDIFSKKYDQSFFEKLDTKFGRGKHILHVGRKNYQKNIETVIRALVSLPNDYKLVQIGLGDEGEYNNLAKKLGVSDRVFFLGGISREELALYYSWADCMCTPSRWEGFGLVFIEACACECPVITSNIGPMNEYLVDEESALLIDEYENSEDMANAILKVCTDGNLAKKLKEGGKKVAFQYDIVNADKAEIQNYNRLFEEYNDKAEKALKNEFEKLNLPFVIYGAGNNGKSFLERMKKYNKTPLCFIDNDIEKCGEIINGINIFGYEKLSSIDGKFIVIVTPYLHADIVKQLRHDRFDFMEMEWCENLLYNARFRNNRFEGKWI